MDGVFEPLTASNRLGHCPVDQELRADHEHREYVQLLSVVHM